MAVVWWRYDIFGHIGMLACRMHTLWTVFMDDQIPLFFFWYDQIPLLFLQKRMLYGHQTHHLKNLERKDVQHTSLFRLQDEALMTWHDMSNTELKTKVRN